MSGSPPSAPTGVPAPRPEDPTAAATADKRTLLIAVVVMFALVVVGVGTAAVFTRSACERLDPDPVAAGAAGTDAGATLTEIVPGDDERVELIQSFEALTDLLGPITGLAEVTGAQTLAPTGSGFAAIGPSTTLLAPDGASVRQRADLSGGQPVGSGPTLYNLAIGNELTGQVDALLPLDGDLEGLTCVDTALVGSPLAFHLAAADGELLLLRVDEDGGEPELELRDPVEGRVWGAPVDVGIAPPGILGERMTAAMGSDLAVMGRRTGPGDDPPALTAIDRSTGTILWTVHRQDLGGLPSDETATRTDVLAVGDGMAVVALIAEPDDAEPTDGENDPDGPIADSDVPVRVVAVDVTDGSALWQLELEAGDEVRDAVTLGERAWTIVASEDGTVKVTEIAGSGEVEGSAEFEGSTGRMATLPSGGALGVFDGGVVSADATSGGWSAIASDLVGRDVVVHEGGVTLLFDTPNERSVAVTFEG